MVDVELSRDQRLLLAVMRLKERVAQLEAGQNEPIAIVGMACRFPAGVRSPEQLWEKLMQGEDLITKIPQSRFDAAAFYDANPDASWKMNSLRAGTVDDIDRFDAALFGISPREAARLDPQQRMLLETTWEVLERSGLSGASLRRERVGVFLGISTQDYLHLQTEGSESPDAHTALGCDPSFAAGRLAFSFGLNGPCLTINTLCSSSLVAAHYACLSLRNREADYALVAGVNAILWPTQSVITSKFRALSPEGMCRTFDAAANGFVRGEGCGVIVLRPLSKVLRSERVLAVIRGSAVNHDGRGSGFTAPNGRAQSELIRLALSHAEIDPDQVGLIETHGTGTRLGDPIEVAALLETYGKGEKPCALGAIKSNLGHTEAAAGIAGVIKAVLSARNGAIPPNLHFSRLNPEIDLSTSRCFIPERAYRWPEGARIAAVSSFGMSGTNAHLLLAAAENAGEGSPEPCRQRYVLRVSAKTQAALRELSQRHAVAILASDAPLADVASTLNDHRFELEQRLCVVAGNRDEASELLRRYAETGKASGRRAVSGAASDHPKIGFLFTGQSSQYIGMGRSLAEQEPIVRQTLERCDARLRERGFEPVLPIVFGADERLLGRASIVQPAMYAVECALADLFEHWGIVPQLVLGHSIGEYAAAYAARVFDLEDGAELVATRGRLIERMTRSGSMLAVSAAEAKLRGLLTEVCSSLEIAAYNSDEDLVVGGDAESVGRFQSECARRGIRTQPLVVSHAFHSVAMDPVLDVFYTAARSVPLGLPRCDIFSSKSGRLAGSRELSDAGYWRDQIRSPVLFSQAVRAAESTGVDIWLELGPQPSLSAVLARGRQTQAATIATLRKGQDDESQILAAVAELAVRGASVDWSAVDHNRERRLVELPTYPFEGQRHWLDAKPRPAERRPETNEVVTLTPVWQRQARPEDGGREGCEGWLLLSTSAEASTARSLCRSLVAAGHTARLELMAADVTGEQLAVEADAAFRHIVLLGDADPDANANAKALAERDRQSLFGVVAALRAAKRLNGCRVHVVTRRTQAALASEPVAIGGAILWGVSRTLGLEQPEQAGKRVDVDDDEASIAGAAAELTVEDGERDICYRAGERFVLRLLRTANESPAELGSVRSDASYLVTGGTGGLGLEVTEWLLGRGAGIVLVLSRRGEHALDAVSPEAAARWRAIRGLGTRLRFAACDVTDASAVRACIGRLSDEGKPLRGVIHAAGVAHRSTLEQLGTNELEQTIRPKSEGAYILHELVEGLQLDFFVMFSSIASAWGAQTLGLYAAANAALDGLARHRHSRGLPTTSVQWGPWFSPGMSSDEQREFSKRAGIESLEPEIALAALGGSIKAGIAEAVVARLDLARFAAAMQVRLRMPMLDALIPPGAQKVRVALATGIPVGRWREAPSEGRRAALQQTVREHVAMVLGVEQAHRVPMDQGLFGLGLDSLLAVELRARLEGEVGHALPATLALDAPTVEALTDALYELAPRQMTERAALAIAPGDPVAIVGAACRFPGGVADIDGLWRLLESGQDAIRDVPPRNWPASLVDADPNAPGKASTLAGGYLDDVRRFDAEFFNITPREACNMDPQQRLLLEVAWEAIERAGHAPQHLRNSRTGVFVGVGQNDYGLGGVSGFDPSYYASGNAPSAIAGRLGYVLGLRGPCMAIDAACASSLVALHAACQSLRNGESEAALAAGVNVILSAEGHIALTKAKMLSPDGRCMTFDARANGYVRGEGCAVLVLKTLARATADGDAVWAVIRGSSVNQNGTSSGFTVPSGAAQELVIDEALQQAATAPHEVDYVEAHGTGTSLGDPIEVRALAAAYGRGRDASRPLLIGSIKSNIGHLEAAAGMAGLLKTVLALQRGVLPASLHFATPNPAVPWSEIPVRVVRESCPWPTTSGPRVAGVSSFGFSGTNAHVLVADAPASARAGAAPASLYLLKLSARTRAALRELARRYRGWLASLTEEELPDACATANAGRGDFPCRAAFVAPDLAGLAEQLTMYSDYGLTDGATSFEDGSGATDWPLREVPSAASPPAELARAYVAGAEIAWRDLYPQFARCALPTYPFQSREHWLETGPTVPSSGTTNPLGRRLDVAAAEAVYELGLTAEQPSFLAHHHVFGRVVVPGTFHVALALSAAMEASGSPRATLNDVTFERPMALDGRHSTLQIALIGGRWSTLSRTGDSNWVTHATGTYHHDAVAPSAPPTTLATRPMSGAEFYRLVGDGDLLLGESFRWIAEIERGEGIAIARLNPGPGLVPSEIDGYAVFPGLLDSCFQVLAGAADIGRDMVAVPIRIGRLALMQKVTAKRLIGHARLSRAADGMFIGDVILTDEQGQVLLAVDDLTVRQTSREAFLRSARRQEGHLARVTWSEWRPSGVTRQLGALLIAGDDALSATLDQPLGSRGLQVARCTPNAADSAAALERVLRGGATVDLVLSCLEPTYTEPLDPTPLSAVLAAALSWIRLIHDLDVQQRVKLWFLLPGGHSADCAAPHHAAASALAGFARAYRREHPSRHAACIYVDTMDPSFAAAGIIARLLDAAGEPEVALTASSGALVPGLERVHGAAGREPAYSPDACYLITGGTGALGLSLAGRLVDRGARHLVLMSRSTPSDAVQSRFEALRRAGAEVCHVRGDVASRRDVFEVMGQVRALARPIKGIFHTAGVLQDARIETLGREQIELVLRPKTLGAWLLHEASLDLSLDWFVLYSSLSALVGSIGQAHYAAANSYLDALAQARKRAGLPGLSVNFGPWKGEGMFGRSPASGRFEALEPIDALDALEQAMCSEFSQLAVAPFAGLGFAGAGRRLRLSALDKTTTRSAPDGEAARLVALPDDIRPRRLTEWLQRVLAEISGLSTPDPHRSLSELGLDSLMAVDLRSRLALDLGVNVDVADLLSGPSLAELAQVIHQSLSNPSSDRRGNAASSNRDAARWIEGEL